MRQKTQAICLLLSASLLFAPGVSLSAQAKTPESILSAENSSEAVTPESVDELIEKNALFADFQAVQNDQVYTTGSDFYQQTSKTCDFIEDLYHVLNGSEDGEYHFLKKI